MVPSKGARHIHGHIKGGETLSLTCQIKSPNVLISVLPGDKVDYKLGQTICVKTHGNDQNSISNVEGGIVLIRNPYSAITAHMMSGRVIQERKDVYLNFFNTSSKWSVAEALQCQY